MGNKDADCVGLWGSPGVDQPPPPHRLPHHSPGQSASSPGSVRPRRASPALGRRWVCRPKFRSHQVRKGTPAPPWGKPRVMRRRGRGPPIMAPITLTLGRTCSSGLADPAGTHSLATASRALQGGPPRRGPGLPQPSRLPRPLPPNSSSSCSNKNRDAFLSRACPPRNPTNSKFKRELCGDFPDGPVVRNPSFQCRGHGFDLWSGN